MSEHTERDDETPRQRYLRNHGENIRLMRLAIRTHEAAGNHAVAAEMRAIADAWEAIGRKAKAEEAGS